MEADFETHLSELISRIKVIAAGIAIFSAIGWFISEPILLYMQESLELQLHAIEIYEVIYTRLNIAILIGFCLALPLASYQLLKFAEPGLKKKEYIYLRNFLPLSFLLFGAGSIFAYEFVIKNAFNFFYAQTMVAGIEPVWSLQNTINFLLRISVLTGLLFQTPLIILLLNKLELVDRSMLEKNRPYFIITILFISALATPPDIITQILITAPIILLYETSLRLTK